MTQICWWLVDRVSRLLEPDERDAVRGDFAEAGVTGGKALLDLLGLVARRQVALWADWRPWLALVGIVGPVGLLLIDFSIFLTRGFDLLELHFWIFFNYTDIKRAFLDQTALTAHSGIVRLFCYSFLLVAWSWTSGFVLGSLSRRTIWLNGALFCCLVCLFFSVVLDATLPPQPSKFLLLATALFLLPFFWGVRQGLRLGTLRPLQAILLAAAIASLTALAIWTGGWWHGGAWQARQLLLSMTLCWPVWYMVATASWRHWRGKTVEPA